MVLALDALWVGVLIVLLAIFCTASLMSVRVWFALMLVVIVIGLALTVVSTVNKRRRERIQLSSDQTMLVEYLKSHGIGGDLSQLAKTLGIGEERALKLLLSLEAQGTIPAGSVKALAPNKPNLSSHSGAV